MRGHASWQGGKRALTFLQDGEQETGQMTYSALDERARVIAGWLQTEYSRGERVLLMFPSGLDFVTAFLGCLYAGVVAVPVYPPKLNRNVLRLRSVLDDARPALAMTTAQTRERMQPLLAESGLEGLRLMAVDEIPEEAISRWHMPDIGGSTVAFLQYTSGSTSNPKGVMVTHANLLANHAMIRAALGQTQESRVVTWLPLFHDMGLILNLLQALYLGSECIFMPPEAFLVKPYRWLAAISKYRATSSGAPNFAYDMCLRKVTADQRSTLDLSCWETADVAAEPVRHGTLERFVETFASSGFRKAALNPCYGLAEATVLVSGAGKGKGFQSTTVSAADLEQHRVTEVAADATRDFRTFVSNGHTWLEQAIVIVHPESGKRCAPDEVGEIWVSGPHVAQGYWNRPEETKRTFGAEISGEDGRQYLRTGDLGFFRNGGLHIAGRIKDLIIIAGRNHDPSDIELTVGASHAAVRPGCYAAFQTEVGDESLLVVAVELERTSGVATGSGAARSDRPLIDAESVVDDIRQAVAEHHDLLAYEVVLLKPASIPKTSSGKIQRHACHLAWLSGTLNLWDAVK